MRCPREGCSGSMHFYDDGHYVEQRCLLCGRGREWQKILVPRPAVDAPPFNPGPTLIERLMAPVPVPELQIIDPKALDHLSQLAESLLQARLRGDWARYDVLRQERADAEVSYLEEERRRRATAEGDRRYVAARERREWAEQRRARNSYHGGSHGPARLTSPHRRGSDNPSFDNVIDAYETVWDR